MSNDKDSLLLHWVIFIVFAFIAVYYFKNENKEYDSSVYSSWEEQEIDALQAEVANLTDKLEESHSKTDDLESALLDLESKIDALEQDFTYR